MKTHMKTMKLVKI